MIFIARSLLFSYAFYTSYIMKEVNYMWIEEFRVLVLVNQLHEDGKSNEYICKATGISETKCKEYITLGNKFKRV